MHLTSLGEIVLLIFAAVLVAFIAAALIFSSRRARKRRESLQRVAQEIGFDFKGDDWFKAAGWNRQPGPKEMGTALFVYLGGTGSRISNVMIGSAAGLEASLFDFSYKSRMQASGTVGNRDTNTIAAFHQNLCLPFFTMHRTDSLDRAVNSIDHQNIEFPSHPEFSRRYVVRGFMPVLTKGREEENARNNGKIQQLFSPALIAYFEQLSSKRNWRIEGAGNQLILYSGLGPIRPDYLRSFLEEASSIAKSFLGLCGLAQSAA
jgi:hypothetical protein